MSNPSLNLVKTLVSVIIIVINSTMRISGMELQQFTTDDNGHGYDLLFHHKR